MSSRCCCGLPRVPGERCLHGGTVESSRGHLLEQARKRKANDRRSAPKAGFPTHREVQEAAARVSPIEARHRAFWTRRRGVTS